MTHFTLATDFDGTIASQGTVNSSTIRALETWRARGNSLFLVTGRTMASLTATFDRIDLFDCVVAENGGVLHWPARGAQADSRLADPPSAAFVTALDEAGVVPLVRGHVLLATIDVHASTVVNLIEQHGLDLQLAFNKGALMLLPPGVTKESGLSAALEQLGLTWDHVIAVGDAENDLTMLRRAWRSVAVANALPSVRGVVDRVVPGTHGEGVAQAMELFPG